MHDSYWKHTVLAGRLSRRRAIALTSGGAAAAALLAACGGSDSGSSTGDSSSLVTQPVDTTKQAKRGGVRKHYVRGDPATLDPAIANIVLNPVQYLVYGELFRLKAGYLKDPEDEVEGHLAESWEWAPDGLTLTLKMRQGVKMHNVAPVNGRVFDVEDVLFSWKRFESNGGDRASFANSVSPDAPIQSVTATDSRTISIKLTRPVVWLLAVLAHAGSGKIKMLPREFGSGFDPRNQIIGMGPYVMSNYTPSVGFTFKAHPDYWEREKVFADQIDMPVLSEYATAMAQLKAGNLHSYDQLRGEDVLVVKRETPALNLYQTQLIENLPKQMRAFGWLAGGGPSPFTDQRVRQAASMSIDRDLWIDTFYNIEALKAEGLPAEITWNSSIYPNPWLLNPRNASEFGENAKYYKHDIAEAKKLMSAAGFANGIDVPSYYIGGSQYGADFQRRVEVLDNFAAEVGFRPSAKIVDYANDFIPNYRNGLGKHDGWTYKQGSTLGNDAVLFSIMDHYSKGSLNFHGMQDAYVDSTIDKMQAEVDTQKRRTMFNELERYLAGKMYEIRFPGGTRGFTLAWPALQNFNTYVGGRDLDHGYHFWIDDTKPPLAST